MIEHQLMALNKCESKSLHSNHLWGDLKLYSRNQKATALPFGYPAKCTFGFELCRCWCALLLLARHKKQLTQIVLNNR